MDDVRGQLHRHLANHIGGFCVDAMDWGQVADTILERFDVTPKPVVTPEELGRMVVMAWHGNRNPETVLPVDQEVRRLLGNRLIDELDAAGLRLERCDE